MRWKLPTISISPGTERANFLAQGDCIKREPNIPHNLIW
jgi:hypothetical protein